MSYESAHCGPSRTNSEKGIINGAQWSSFKGGELIIIDYSSVKVVAIPENPNP